MELTAKRILYVDDDADDREFLVYAFKKLSPETELVLAGNGIEALNFLHTAGERPGALPSLIVLDLNMPFLDGRETFERIRADEALRHIPTIVFTSGENPHDKALFNSLGIELITKPDNLAYMDQIAGRMLRACA